MTDELTLRDIAKAVQAKHGATGRGLDAIAERRGHRLSYTTINSMINGTYRSVPSRATLDALVDMSDFTAEQVYGAAGKPLPLRPLAEDMPEGADSLYPDQRETVLAVVRQFVKDNERKEVGTDEQTEASPIGDGPSKPRGRRGRGKVARAVPEESERR